MRRQLIGDHDSTGWRFRLSKVQCEHEIANAVAAIKKPLHQKVHNKTAPEKGLKMRIRLGKCILLLGLIPVLVTGCVTYPIARNIQDQAQPLTLAQVKADPGACQGTIVIWGGRIIKTVNDANRTALYVLELPLGGDGRPLEYANTSGRFIASSKGFLDPEVYRPGRLVTVAGAVAGLESEPVQNAKYIYPVVTVKQIHLWPVERTYYNDGYSDYPYGYWYGYYPGWYWWGWYPAWGWGGWGWYGHDRDWNGGWHYQSQGGHSEGAPPSGHWGGAYHYQGGPQGGSPGRGGGGGRGGGHWHR